MAAAVVRGLCVGAEGHIAVADHVVDELAAALECDRRGYVHLLDDDPQHVADVLQRVLDEREAGR